MKSSAYILAEKIINGQAFGDAKKEREKFIKAQIKLRQKQEKERLKGKMGKKRWITAVVSLGIVAVVMTGAFIYMLFAPKTSDNALESVYKKSFYETVENVENIDLNLSKTLATKDQGAMSGYLLNAVVNSELAENNVQQLPLSDQNKYYTAKLLNQVGDYAKYLANKINNGKEVSSEERQTLYTLYDNNKTLIDALGKMSEFMDNYNFSAISNDDLVIKGFNNLENLSVEYPQLIYDGPFSDGKNNKTKQQGKEVSNEECLEKFRKIFSAYQLTDEKIEGQSNGDIKTINISALKDGQSFYASFANDGNLLMFSYAGSCKELNITQEQAQESAINFIEKLGISNMKAVWINQSGNVFTINYAGEIDGTIIYPDLIKVRVCGETGLVIGIEGTSYYLNHKERSIDIPSISEEQAKQSVSDNITIKSIRLALTPVGQSEILCYEVCGEYDESTYYVYIDAKTSKQVEMFKVIKAGEGSLLM